MINKERYHDYDVNVFVLLSTLKYNTHTFNLFMLSKQCDCLIRITVLTAINTKLHHLVIAQGSLNQKFGNFYIQFPNSTEVLYQI